MPVDFGALDPQAAFHGAANMNALLQQWARTRAGGQVARGDTTGAVRTLQNEGDFVGANTVTTQQNAHEDRIRAASDRDRTRAAQFNLEVASSLDRVRAGARANKQDSNAAVIAAWQQLQPVFQHQGVAPEELQVLDQAIQANPDGFIDALHARSQAEINRYRFLNVGNAVVTGDTQSGTTQESYRAPARVTLGDARHGQSVVEVDPGLGVRQDGDAPEGVSGDAAPEGPTAPGLATPPAGTPSGAAAEGAAAGPVSYVAPFGGNLVTSGFGQRRRPRAGATTDHHGVDYGVLEGTPVPAVADGEVIHAGPDGGLGNSVRVRHSDGTVSIYGHLSRPGVRVGDPVIQGSPIGLSGATGTVTGPNMHLEFLDARGRPVDPMRVLRGQGAAPPRATGDQTEAPAGTRAPGGGGRVIVSTPPHPDPVDHWRPMTPAETRARNIPPDAMDPEINDRTNLTRFTMPRAAPGGANARPPGTHPLSGPEQADLRGIRTSLRSVEGMLGPLQEFVTLNRGQETGGNWAIPGVGEILSPFNPRLARMRSLTAELTPQQRRGLPGAASDRDVAMFARATVGITNPRATNEANYATAQAFVHRQQDYVAYLEAYANEHGTLNGAQEGWSRYVNENPLFEERGSHPIVRRVPPWRSVPYLSNAVGPQTSGNGPGTARTVARYHYDRAAGRMVPDAN